MDNIDDEVWAESIWQPSIKLEGLQVHHYHGKGPWQNHHQHMTIIHKPSGKMLLNKLQTIQLKGLNHLSVPIVMSQVQNKFKLYIHIHIPQRTDILNM
jgi:hypothetical protein